MGRTIFFISYRREEHIQGRRDGQHFAYAVHERLVPYGCYQDTHMNAGDFWVQIEEQLRQCSTVVLLLSPHALDGREGGEDYFRREIETGLKLGKTFLIVRYRANGREEGTFRAPEGDEMYRRLMDGRFEEVIYDPYRPDELNACLTTIVQKVHASVGNEVSGLLYQRSAAKLRQYMQQKFGSALPERALIADALIRPHALSEQKEKPLGEALRDADVLDDYRRHVPVQIVARGGQGKSTQLMLLWHELLEAENLSQPDERCVCLYHSAEHLRLEEGGDLMRTVVDSYLPGLTQEQYQALVGCMREPATGDPTARPTAWQYFIMVDGLDEAKPVYAERIRAQLRHLASIDAGFGNLQIIVASRSEDRSLFTVDSRTIELKNLDPKKQALQVWLDENGLGDLKAMMQGRHGAALANPMMLTLVNHLKKEPLDEEYKVFPAFSRGPACVGQILWNYCQSLVCKYAREHRENKRLAEKAMWYILPELASRRVLWDGDQQQTGQQGTSPEGLLTERDLKRACRKHLTRAENTEETRAACLDIITKHFRLMTPAFSFSHRLFTDFFAMVHIGNVTDMLLDAQEDPDECPPPGEEDLALMYDPDVFDATENIDLLVSVLPVRCDLRPDDPGAMLRLARELRCEEPISLSSPPEQLALHFAGVLYPGWVAQCFALDADVDPALIRTMVDLSYNRALALGRLLLKEPGLIPPLAAINVLSMMSQYCRTSWLRNIPKEKTLIPALSCIRDGRPVEKPDLTQALIYARAALETGMRSTGASVRLMDGYNYTGKVFNSAKERIQNHLRLEEGPYPLTDSDLLFTSGASLTAEEAALLTPDARAALENGRAGDVLTREEAASRAMSLRTLAYFWLEKATENHCVPSLNLMALISEMEQEEKPEGTGDFRRPLDFYLQASREKHTLSLYSASKAAQLLAEKKAALDHTGAPCLPRSPEADEDVTVQTAERLFGIAASSTPEIGKNSFYRGMLTLNYPGGMGETEALRTAMEYFSRAFGRWNQVITLITVLDTALRLMAAEGAADRLQDMARACMEMLLEGSTDWGSRRMNGVSIARFRRNASGIRRADAWTPSPMICADYMQRLTATLTRHAVLLDQLGLGAQARRCLEAAALLSD